jgi:hypothetical protein
LLNCLSQRSSLSGGSFGGSNWNSTVSDTLRNKPIFRRSLVLCVSEIGLAGFASGFASFSMRANGPWKRNQLRQRRDQENR